jgi:hypothetical protein
MRRLGNLNFLVIFSILLLINGSTGLTCWRCSSDGSNSKFCGAAIDFSQITESNKRWNYVECDAKPSNNVENNENLIPKCRILLQLVNGVETYTRSCHWEHANAPSDSCKVQRYNPSYVKTIDCRTCVEDGCNDRLNIISEQKDNLSEAKNNNNNNNENSAPVSPSSAQLAVLSHLILFVSMVIIIGY